MENRIPQILAVPTLFRMTRLALAGSLLLFLGACDRPGTPPSPANPSRPQMKAVSAVPVPDVHTAIFNYARPARHAPSSLEPNSEIGTRGRLQV